LAYESPLVLSRRNLKEDEAKPAVQSNKTEEKTEKVEDDKTDSAKEVLKKEPESI